MPNPEALRIQPLWPTFTDLPGAPSTQVPIPPFLLGQNKPAWGHIGPSVQLCSPALIESSMKESSSLESYVLSSQGTRSRAPQSVRNILSSQEVPLETVHFPQEKLLLPSGIADFSGHKRPCFSLPQSNGCQNGLQIHEQRKSLVWVDKTIKISH